MSEFETPEKLCVERHNNCGEIHGQCTHTHGEVDSPSNKQSSSRRDGNHVIGRCPQQILDHFSVRGPREFDCAYNVAGSLRTRTIPADSTATSVPAPIAIPTSA